MALLISFTLLLVLIGDGMSETVIAGSMNVGQPGMTTSESATLVVSELTTLQLSPSIIIENSPGLKPGAKVKCERIQIYGLSRHKHLDKYAASVKVKVSLTNTSGRLPNIGICFHRNFSLGVGMCPQDQWERLTEGSWVKSMSPFDYKVLDIRMPLSLSDFLEVSLTEDYFLYRPIFLFLGILMMTLASWLSKSLPFYYSGAMTVGVLLVILMVLFQGMKLLPTGRKSSLAIFIYSCFVGFGAFLLRYVPRLLRLLLIEIGLSEDLYDPLTTFLLVFFIISGAWLGFWVVHKLVLTEDGSVDEGVSHFVTWAIRIVASLMILQSSMDPLLAAEALVLGIFISSAFKMFMHSKVVGRVCEKVSRPNRVNHTTSSTRAPTSPSRGSTSGSISRFSNSETFYSTFHSAPRKDISKTEWKSFTRESTKRALEGLVSSPDFSKWAVKHADRITLAPRKDSVNEQKRWFQWRWI